MKVEGKQSKLANKRITKSCKSCNKQVVYFDVLCYFAVAKAGCFYAMPFLRCVMVKLTQLILLRSA